MQVRDCTILPNEVDRRQYPVLHYFDSSPPALGEVVRVMSADTIRVYGAREHNLQDVSLELPRNNLVVFCGVSGSGKSSLAFDTIYAEGRRRYMEALNLKKRPNPRGTGTLLYPWLVAAERLAPRKDRGLFLVVHAKKPAA